LPLRRRPGSATRRPLPPRGTPLGRTKPGSPRTRPGAAYRLSSQGRGASKGRSRSRAMKPRRRSRSGSGRRLSV
jgi:hypothetical protein